MSPVGRPQVGQPINIRLGAELLARVDAYAEACKISRAETLRRLVEAGLYVANTADPSDETTWHKPCWNCGHTPGAELNDLGYVWCAECNAD